MREFRSIPSSPRVLHPREACGIPGLNSPTPLHGQRRKDFEHDLGNIQRHNSARKLANKLSVRKIKGNTDRKTSSTPDVSVRSPRTPPLLIESYPSLVNIKTHDKSGQSLSPDCFINDQSNASLSNASSDTSIFSFNVSDQSSCSSPIGLSSFSRSLKSFRHPRPLSPLVTGIIKEVTGLTTEEDNKDEEETKQAERLTRVASYRRSAKGR